MAHDLAALFVDKFFRAFIICSAVADHVTRASEDAECDP
jgi:hypothetical protein